MKSGLRKYIGVLVGIILYYIVHEGAHLIVALAFGIFKEIRFMGVGIQITVTDPSVLTNLQFAFFNLAGAAASLSAAYLLVIFAKRICNMQSKGIKAICFYSTIILLLNDAIYLSILCGFFGGGDMNGIVLFGVPEWAARISFGLIGIINLCLIKKLVLPFYKTSFHSYGELH